MYGVPHVGCGECDEGSSGKCTEKGMWRVGTMIRESRGSRVGWSRVAGDMFSGLTYCFTRECMYKFRVWDVFCFPTVYYLMRSLSPNSGRGRVNTSGEAMIHEVKSWRVCRANLRAVRGVTESG